MAEFRRLQRRQRTAVLIATHDPMVAEFADRTLEFQAGRLRIRETAPAAAGG